MDYTNIDDLRSTGAVPYFFGLGFIQLKLTDSQRMHFYHPDLKAISGKEEVHNHRYDFTSNVLVGEFSHTVWEFIHDPEGDHEKVLVSCKPDAPADPTPIGCGRIRHSGFYTLAAGSSYRFPATQFHDVFAQKAVTFLTRGPIMADIAVVIRLRGNASVCPFSEKIPESRCWDMIADLLTTERFYPY